MYSWFIKIIFLLMNLLTMEQKEADAEQKCKHLWTNLGSSCNGKTYKRCERCGLVKEDPLAYII